MKCCHLILRDVPENTELGIDLMCWRVGKYFKGIKDIPLGIHFVYYSAVNSDCLSGQRVGFVTNVSEPGFIVKKWQKEEEDFVDVNLTDDEIERIISNFDEISMYLGQYPIDSYRDWISLSNFITGCTLTRLIPHCGRLYSCPHFLSEPSNTQKRLALKNSDTAVCSSNKNPEDLLPSLSIIPGTEVRFTSVPTKPVYPSHSSPTEITAHCMDQTYTLCATLDLILSTVPPEKTTAVDSNLEPTRELLGEFQFAFLNLLLNHSIEGWEQWRRIFQLLANCEKAIVDYPNLYIDFITVIYHQLNNASKPELPNDNSTVELLDIFFSESSSSSTQCKLTERGFLPTMLERLFKNIHSVCISDTISTNNTYPNETNDILKDLFKRAEGFAHSIKRRFKWNVISSSHLSQRCTSDINEIPFEEFDWDGDEAPVVVQL
ncbi:Protein AAR2 isoform 2 [Schistosoma japonicum]|uniref:Protein AAR2 homolog n=1 Tax=Schistosoma japonicum TaxID=6182 RepID=C1L5A0_SCHJA|nr:Protein AAR2 like [Schistosoma japonicum]KAH8864886.1 Protein AAR2 like [Schistosoma japonicum]KAH8864887.1 Protein AAR2 like [Schistosoma japonicum]KAH8864888.1 Protein AAR2 like [Schistosoma japonicum]TNN13248.1 Protein AAR2 isoform 2 [Schistosoma japonicum]